MPASAKVAPVPAAAAAARPWKFAAAAAVEVLPGRLLWAPRGAKLPSGWAGAPRFGLGDVASPDFRGGRYSVPHYPQEAAGSAIGPLAADQTVRFAYELGRRLEGEEKRGVLEFSAGERRNAAVLLGAFLVLQEGWSAADLHRALPSEAKRRFPCSWYDARKSWEPVMSVLDCWEGLELAARLGWIQAGADDLTTTLSCSRYWRCVSQNDGSWLVPGKVFVMADPMTVIKDPNPNTYSRLAPPTPQISRISSGHLSLPATPCSGGEEKELQHQDTASTNGDCEEPGPCESENDMDSVLSVCKVYAPPSQGVRQWPKALDLVSFLKEGSVRGVVRANTGDEPGIRNLGGSYQASEMQRYGLDHLDLLVEDSGGAVPPGKLVEDLLAWGAALGMGSAPEEMAEAEGAVAFHCKSGFGRSVVLACCWIVYLYDVPGRALLGWSRIARPGAITNPGQELFLKSLTGRSDLLRHAQGLPRPHAFVPQGAGACCTLQ